MRATTSSLLQTLVHTASILLSTPLCAPLREAQAELRRRLQLAFSLASLHQRTVIVDPHRQGLQGRLSIRLPEGVRWGRPASIPLPPSLLETGWRDGQPRPITVMPQRKASANVWFLHHRKEALCLRLDLSGSLQLHRYLPLLGTWIPC